MCLFILFQSFFSFFTRERESKNCMHNEMELFSEIRYMNIIWYCWIFLSIDIQLHSLSWARGKKNYAHPNVVTMPNWKWYWNESLIFIIHQLNVSISMPFLLSIKYIFQLTFNFHCIRRWWSLCNGKNKKNYLADETWGMFNDKIEWGNKFLIKMTVGPHKKNTRVKISH